MQSIVSTVSVCSPKESHPDELPSRITRAASKAAKRRSSQPLKPSNEVRGDQGGRGFVFRGGLVLEAEAPSGGDFEAIQEAIEGNPEIAGPNCRRLSRANMSQADQARLTRVDARSASSSMRVIEPTWTDGQGSGFGTPTGHKAQITSIVRINAFTVEHADDSGTLDRRPSLATSTNITLINESSRKRDLCSRVTMCRGVVRRGEDVQDRTHSCIINLSVVPEQ